MTDCKSLADSKLTTAPVLYLPSDGPVPVAVSRLQQQCTVNVRRLPRIIHREGEVRPEEIPVPGLLYLPNPYVVPGGRFNEMYGWDTYFILLGEVLDGRLALARGTVENFFYEIDHYGAILNANRTYYLTRSQPPFLSSMVMLVYRGMREKDPQAATAFLRQALPYLERDHRLWTSAPHLAGDTGLSRYIDLGRGPVPEMADDSSYYIDVIHWLKAHPSEVNRTYLQPASGTPDSHCSHPGNCLRTEADGQQLTESFFTGDRAMRESGFDTSFRFGPFSGSTENFAPVCLNSLLFRYEKDLAEIEAKLGHPQAAAHWKAVARRRQGTMNRLLWDERAGMFFDYNVVMGQRSSYRFVTTYYTLWSGVASPAQARRMVAALPFFEQPGGLAMSDRHTGMQWDAPFGWAPTNWLAVAGLQGYGFDADARRLAGKFCATVERNYAMDGTIREKYNVESADANVAVAAGYKSNVIGFGWTNAVYAQMQEMLSGKGRGVATATTSPSAH
ncbi:MAG TPA: trehalase family glycosidase [Acidobacteriaceae bacterium]|jgi:alpha,alpha-trehalase|nr:trehalase family glycosidase [Acidobacteriaceae bacterium]